MKSAFLVSKGLLCLYDKQNNTWLFVDMEFLFKCSTRQTCALRSLVSYRAKHSKRNSISMRAHVVLSIYLDAEVPPCPEKGGGGGGEEGVSPSRVDRLDLPSPSHLLRNG